ncbi:hypothetical protein FB451DRAFT_1167449 [Mycena latifolia]|nr:hypothetical protein FB451DRAFT_1167449 [Mycena latifolia]
MPVPGLVMWTPLCAQVCLVAVVEHRGNETQGLASGKFAMGRGCVWDRTRKRERRYGRIEKSAHSCTQRASRRDAAHRHGHGHAYLRMPRAQGRPANARGGVRVRLAAGSPLCALLCTHQVRPPSLTAKVVVRATTLGVSRAPLRRLGGREETPSRRSHAGSAPMLGGKSARPLAYARSFPTPVLRGYSPPQAGSVSGMPNAAEVPPRGDLSNEFRSTPI